jgi:hypothetical protein
MRASLRMRDLLSFPGKPGQKGPGERPPASADVPGLRRRLAALAPGWQSTGRLKPCPRYDSIGRLFKATKTFENGSRACTELPDGSEPGVAPRPVAAGFGVRGCAPLAGAGLLAPQPGKTSPVTARARNLDASIDGDSAGEKHHRQGRAEKRRTAPHSKACGHPSGT